LFLEAPGLAWEAQLGQIRPIAERVAASYGLDVFDVQYRRESIGFVLRVILDRPWTSGQPEPADPEHSVSIADCQRVSHDLSAILDVEGALDAEYTLEVSSPGLDRPLRQPSDYARFAGRLAKIVVAEAVDGQKHFAGRLKGLDGDVVLLEEGRRTHRVPLAAIARARLDVEF
jgi:ribosome maturation factor RimP